MDLYAVNHPDWAPTKNMGHQSASVSKASKLTALERHDCVLKQSAKMSKGATTKKCGS